MKLIVWVLAIFTAAVTFALAAQNPGYVLFVYPPYRIELSLTLFLVSMTGLLISGYFVLRLLTTILRLPGMVRSYREQRVFTKGRSAMMEALTAFFEGRYAAAEKAAVRAMESGDQSGINPIIAARSAHELREFGKRDDYLASTAGKSVGETTMRLIAQTEFMLDQKQPQLALDKLKELSATGKHKHIGVLQLELKAMQQSHNWEGVLNVVTQLEKRSAIAEMVATHLRQQAWMEQLRAQPAEQKEMNEIWKSIPGEFRLRSNIAALAAANFIRLNDCKAAQQLLKDSLNRQWSSELIKLYGDCKLPDNVGQIELAETWLKIHPDDPGLLLALGKLCMHLGLWGKAQSYLEASISLMPDHTTYILLAKLADQLEKPGEASRYYQLAQEYQ